jgi:3'(2'), 5'-bisphosphate nucleotidase
MSATLSAPAKALARIAAQAGALILRHYAAGVEAREKADHSPVTAADEDAEALILARLAEIAPQVPVIAEEQAAHGQLAKIGAHFFLVDPLDGTKEFLGRNGEFTVNIAEISNGLPVRGVVYAPARGRLFLGETPGGAFEIALEKDAPDFARARPIRVRLPPKSGTVAVASRSHRDAATEDFLARHGVRECISAGSSLKFCLVAAGEADIYPRLGRTMEWDVAAGHAVLRAAGGTVTGIDGAPFLYGKAAVGFENPSFVARGL